MKNDFEIGSVYYLKIDTSKSIFHQIGSTLSMGFENVEYRINNGAWISVSQANEPITLEKLSNQTNVDVYDYNQTLIGDFSNMIRFEIWGRLSIGYQATQEIDEYLKSIAIKNPITIELDRLNCENNVVNKLSGTNLIYVDKLVGSLREEINLLSPSIVIEYNKVPDFNYVYIPTLQRYYFVTNITNVRYRVYRIDLKVDVLTTYNTDIRKQDAFISRCAGDNYYSVDKIDERLPLSKIPLINLTKMTLATAYRVFNPYQYDSSIKNIALTIVGTSGLTQISKTLRKPSNAQNLPDLHSYLGHSASLVTYAISLADWKTISDLLLSDDTLASYIANVVMFPFALNNDCNVAAGLIPIKLNSTTTGVSGYYMYGHLSDYVEQYIYTFTPRFSNEQNFLNYAPYSKYEMYIPYKGYVELDAHKVLGKTIGLFYVHNYQNGVSMAFIYNETDDYLIDTYQVSVGTLLSVTTTNARENQNQRDSATLNMIMGLVGSAVQMGSGAMSDKFGAVLGGGLTGAKAIMSKLNSDMYIYERGNTTLSSDLTNNFTIMDGWIRETYRIVDTAIDLSVFIKLNGYVWNQYCNLGDVRYAPSGYTEIPEMHYKPDTQTYITKTEIDEIVSLARDGIIL